MHNGAFFLVTQNAHVTNSQFLIFNQGYALLHEILKENESPSSSIQTTQHRQQHHNSSIPSQHLKHIGNMANMRYLTFVFYLSIYIFFHHGLVALSLSVSFSACTLGRS